MRRPRRISFGIAIFSPHSPGTATLRNQGNLHEKDNRDCGAGPVADFFRSDGTGTWRRRRAWGIIRRRGVGADRRRGRRGRGLYRWAINRPFVGPETIKHRPSGRKIHQAGGARISRRQSVCGESRSVTGRTSTAISSQNCFHYSAGPRPGVKAARLTRSRLNCVD